MPRSEQLGNEISQELRGECCEKCSGRVEDDNHFAHHYGCQNLDCICHKSEASQELEREAGHGYCNKCGLETQPVMKCKCPERQADGSWKGLEREWEVRFQEKFPGYLTMNGKFGLIKPRKDIIEFFRKELAKAREESNKLIEDIHLYNTDGVKALEKAWEEGFREATEVVDAYFTDLVIISNPQLSYKKLKSSLLEKLIKKGK